MSLQADAVARRYANRPGCRFVSFRGVGLAVFSMNVRVLSLEPRTVPPLDEFILRLMQEDITSVSELTELLGVDESLIYSRLVELRRTEVIDVAPRSTDENLTCVLTERGRQAAQNLKQSVMQEVTIPNVIFHGLLRKPVDLGEHARRQYLKPREAKDIGLIQVPAIPNRYPHPEEIDVKQLDLVVKGLQLRKRRAASRDVVAVKSILKNVYTLYEPAVMLEYETLDGRHERQVAFVVEGQLMEEYDAVFAKGRGPELLADLMTPKPEPIAERIKQQASPQVIKQLGLYEDAEALASQVATARQEVEDAKQQLSDADRVDTRHRLQQRVTELEAKLAIAERERNERKVKYLWTPEIRAKLWEALRSAETRLLILSGWISSEVVNKEFIAELHDRLEGGVQIWIGYGFDKDRRQGQEQRNKPSWRDAEQALVKLQSEYPTRLTVRDVGRSHEKRLICDNRFTFGGSFNLLSFSGEHRGPGTVRHEGADLIEDAAFCEELYERYLKLFFRPVAPIA